jgi:hypothetical protein
MDEYDVRYGAMAARAAAEPRRETARDEPGGDDERGWRQRAGWSQREWQHLRFLRWRYRQGWLTEWP